LVLAFEYLHLIISNNTLIGLFLNINRDTEKSKEIRNNTLSSERPEPLNLLSAFEER
jgi:hypothetical protein